MKHLVFLLLCCIIAISGSAKVNRTVDYVSDGMIISYDLSSMEVTELKGVYEFNLDGFSHVHSEGVPNVLYRNETPQGRQNHVPTIKGDDWSGEGQFIY